MSKKNKLKEIAAALVAQYDAKYRRVPQSDVIMLDADAKSIEVRKELTAAISNRPTGHYELVNLMNPSMDDVGDDLRAQFDWAPPDEDYVYEQAFAEFDTHLAKLCGKKPVWWLAPYDGTNTCFGLYLQDDPTWGKLRLYFWNCGGDNGTLLIATDDDDAYRKAIAARLGESTDPTDVADAQRWFAKNDTLEPIDSEYTGPAFAGELPDLDG